MKLEELNLDIAGVVSAPLKITAPQPDWLQAKDSGVVPDELFRLYEAAGYLSFGAAPKFLADADNVLFSYFGMLLRGLKQQLSDGVELLDNLKEAHGQLYDPVKKAKGLPWDPTADRRSKRAFRELIVTAYSSLDVTADVIALMFTGRIPGLTVGRAQFGSVEHWLRKPAQPTGAVLTPQDAGMADLRAALTPLVLPVGAERDWVPLVRMLRNKGAHLGDDVFRYFGLLGSDDTLFLFIPREWPYFFEQHMKPSGDHAKESLADLLRRTLVHEDYISFGEGLNTKVRAVVGATCTVLRAAYMMFGAFDLNDSALTQLKKNSRAYCFKHFDAAGTAVAGLRRFPELTRACSPRVDRSMPTARRAVCAHAQEASVLYLSPLVRTQPTRRSSSAGVLGARVPSGPAGAHPSRVAPPES